MTAVIQLIETAQQYASQLEANPVDILDNLTPVLIFASLADAATQIYTTGQQILKEEQEERDEMIIGIVFGLFSVLTMFVGGIEGAFVAAALDTAQLFADMAVTGQFNPGDLASALLDVLGGVFDVLDLDNVFSSIANVLRDTKAENGEIEQGLENFKYYKEVRDVFQGASCAA